MSNPWFDSELATLSRLYQLIPKAERHLYTNQMIELVQKLQDMCKSECSVIEFVALLTSYDRAMVRLFEQVHKHK